MPLPPGATVPIRVAHRVVEERWPRAVSLGVHACREKRGEFVSSADPGWSEHAFDNAEDWGGPPDVVRAIYAWARVQPYLTEVLLYTGAAHVHYAGRPLRGAGGRTPPCAGGPDVPSGIGGRLQVALEDGDGGWIDTVGRWARIGAGAALIAAAIGLVATGRVPIVGRR